MDRQTLVIKLMLAAAALLAATGILLIGSVQAYGAYVRFQDRKAKAEWGKLLAPVYVAQIERELTALKKAQDTAAWLNGSSVPAQKHETPEQELADLLKKKQ